MDYFILKLISTILGGFSAILLFFFGIPAMTESDTRDNIVTNVTEDNKKSMEKFRVFSNIGKVALLMLCTSFILQFIILLLEK